MKKEGMPNTLIILVIFFVIGLILGYSFTGEAVRGKKMVIEPIGGSGDTSYGAGSYGIGIYQGSTTSILTTVATTSTISGFLE